MSDQALIHFQPIALTDIAPIQAVAKTKIERADQNATAIDALTLVKRLSKAIEERRAELKRPHLEAGREIDAQAKLALEPLDSLERAIKNQIADWDRRERERIAAEQRRIAEENERRRREAEEAAARERARVQAETAQLATAAGMTADDAAELALLESESVTTETPVLDVAPVHQATARAAGGMVNVRMRRAYEITDPERVPVEYCSPDPGKIRRAVEAGAREIPGVRIYEEPIVSARAV